MVTQWSVKPWCAYRVNPLAAASAYPLSLDIVTRSSLCWSQIGPSIIEVK